MKTIQCFLFAALLCLFGPILMGAAGSSFPVVQISQEIHDLEIDRESPKYVLVAGHMTFQWKAAELPGFSVNHLDFLNNTDEVMQSVEERENLQGLTTVTLSFRGRFECHNNFSAYPFNIARVAVIFKKPAGNYTLQSQSLSPGAIRRINELPQSGSYSIVGRKFIEGVFYRGHGIEENASAGDIHALGLYLDVAHKPLRTIILILLPLLAIWGVSYSSQWWKEESASSRGIMASLFAATAVAISSTNLAPNVSCPTAVILAFCCYYISLMVLGILTVNAFREKTRSHPDGFRRVRITGRILGPVMLMASVVFLALWVSANRYPENCEWIEDAVEVSQSGKKTANSAKTDDSTYSGLNSLLRCLECSPSSQRHSQ